MHFFCKQWCSCAYVSKWKHFLFLHRQEMAQDVVTRSQGKQSGVMQPTRAPETLSSGTRSPLCLQRLRDLLELTFLSVTIHSTVPLFAFFGKKKKHCNIFFSSPPSLALSCFLFDRLFFLWACLSPRTFYEKKQQWLECEMALSKLLAWQEKGSAKIKWHSPVFPLCFSTVSSESPPAAPCHLICHVIKCKLISILPTCAVLRMMAWDWDALAMIQFSAE